MLVTILFAIGCAALVAVIVVVSHERVVRVLDSLGQTFEIR